MQFRDYQAYLIFAVFIASGISFLDGALPRILVRITTGLVGAVIAIAITGGILFGIGFSAAFGARSFGPDGPRMLGAALLVLYFVICALTCLPVWSARKLRFIGLVMHFVNMPIAVFLTTFSSIDLPWDMQLWSYGNSLSWGLIYAMLWFRMVEKQTPDNASAELAT